MLVDREKGRNRCSYILPFKWMKSHLFHIITACIRRMREGNSFSLSTLVGERGGTMSQVWMGGIPSEAQTGGTPSEVQMGGTPLQVQTVGYPIPDLDWGGVSAYQVQMGGTLSQVQTVRVPHPRSGWGCTPFCWWWGGVPIQYQDGGTPIQDWTRLDGVPPCPRLDGVPPVWDWMGYPSSETGWLTLPPRLDRVPPLSKTGWLTPLSETGWLTLPPRLDGVPPPIKDWMGYPLCQGLDGVPTVQAWMGYPISKASTCYVAGGVPLAFTHEDFLVSYFMNFITYQTEIPKDQQQFQFKNRFL